MGEGGGSGTIVIIVLLLIGIGIIWWFYGSEILSYLSKVSVSPRSPAQNVVQGGKSLWESFYSSLNTVYNIISDPESYYRKYMLTESTEVSEETKRYYILLSESSSAPGVVRTVSNDTYVATSSIISYIFSYNLPSSLNNLQVSFTCNNSLPILSCFYSENSTIGFVNQSSADPSNINFNNFQGIAYIRCTIPEFKINASLCKGVNETGFKIYNKLEAIFNNVETYSVYNFLVVNSDLAYDANLKGITVYQSLGLIGKYDVAVSYGIYNLPYIQIARAAKVSGHPVLIFEKETSYDVILLSISSLQNMESISKFSVRFIYNPNKVIISYISSNGCSNSFDFGNDLFKISCSQNSCEIYISEKYLKKMQKENRLLIVAIPICITPGSNFQGYETVYINSTMLYSYKIVGSGSVEYIGS